MAFTFAAFCYIVALILTVLLIFFAVYQIISFDELKTDYKNPIDQCNNLNPLVLPEYLLLGIMTVLFLLAGEFFSVFWNLPLCAWNIHRWMNRPVMSNLGLYDPTTIMSANELSRAMKEGWCKLAFCLLSFFYYLYSMITSLGYHDAYTITERYAAFAYAYSNIKELEKKRGGMIRIRSR